MNAIHREIVDGKFCVLRFDQPDSKANLFSMETLAELDGHLRDIAADAAIRGVVFISAKERVFHAGADLHTLEKMSKPGLQRFLELGQEVFSHVAALKATTVAAVHGVCLGGGCELALACDYRIATPDKVTKIGLPETKLGILPAWGGSTRLPRLVGVTRALKMILAGQTPSAKQALRYGMIDVIAPHELLLSTALRALKDGRMPRRSKWLRQPFPNKLISWLIRSYVRARVVRETRGHYPARLKAAEVVMASALSSVEESLARERKALLELAETDTCKNLIRLFFMGERVRKSDGAKIKPVERAAVIGAGVMGSGIAEWLASHGVRVILRDVDPKFVAKGLERIRKLFDNRRVFTEKEARDGMDRISPATGEVSLEQVDLVIEAAVEKLEAKKQIFADLDRQASGVEKTLLATNTSALALAEIAEATKHPGRVVGIHFFNPVHKMQLVEVVSVPQTAPDTVLRAMQFVRQIGKLPVLVRDSPGFLVNRILVPYLLEAGLLFVAGARITDVDEAMLDFGMPMGPLRLIDEVGVDIAVNVTATLVSHFPDRLRKPEELDRMASAGWLGRKSGRGFYVYPRKGKIVPHDGMAALQRSRTAAGLERSQIQRRLALLLANEAARCLEEKIVESPDMVDFAVVMGTGFAPFRGGPLRFADAYGLSQAIEHLERLTVEAGPHFTPSPLLKRMAAEGKHFYEN